MPPAANDRQSICEEFRAAWNSETPPSIEVFLERVAPTQVRETLLALLELDIRLRRADKQQVSLATYSQQNWFAGYIDDVQVILATEGAIGGSDVGIRQPESIRSANRSLATHAPGSVSDFDSRSNTPVDQYATGEVSVRSQRNQTIGNYVLSKRIGSGGMGEVYLAHHERFRDRQYAIKVIRQDYASSSAIDRFEREIDAMGHLSHPNLVFAADAGRWHDQLYLVMQYVAGLDLQQVLEKVGPLPVGEACTMIRQAAFGVAHAHQAGIVHRDIKPSNLMLSHLGELMVLDLGLAGLERDGNQLTAEGVAIGTAAFMSPEQWHDSRSVGKPSDVYALGCTLYGLLTGKPPFSWDGNHSLPALMTQHVKDEPVAAAVRRPNIPSSLSDLISQTLHKSPEDRPLVSELASKLLPFCENSSLQQSLTVVLDHLKSDGASDRSPSHFTGNRLFDAASPDQSANGTAAQRVDDTFVSGADDTRGDRVGEDSNALTLQWSRNQTDVVSSNRLTAIALPIVVIGTISLVMAYYGPNVTETWIQRFDRLEMRDVPAGTGFLIELARLIVFIGLTIFVVGSRFTNSIREFFNLRKWDLKVSASRLVTAIVIGFFVAAESRRHLNLEMAPQDMVTWGEAHGISTTAVAEAGPYASYLPYSLISYIIVLGGLFTFPFLRFWLSDFSYIQRQVNRFSSIQANVKSAELALGNLHRFAHECHSMTKRYVDVLGMLCVGIHYEYWVGQLTLTGAGIQTAIMGWFAAAFALAFVVAISGSYVRGYNVTEEVVASQGSLEDGVRIGSMSVAWFLKKTFLSQLGGILVLSLIVVALHAMLAQ